MRSFYSISGYYQPAGPLIQHPPTLPPVKGPPPEPTPTPPQNSEGSDDLVATSASSGTSGKNNLVDFSVLNFISLSTSNLFSYCIMKLSPRLAGNHL